jgi:hypothetical protein
MLNQRERRAVMVEEVATIWSRVRALCDTCARPRLPAVQAGLFLSWPHDFRLRVESVFGTSLDLGLAGDSLTAYLPAQRAGVALDAVRDSLDWIDPGSRVVQLMTGVWRPPDSAWLRGTWEGALIVLRWSEGADSVALALDGDGRPVRVLLASPAGHGIRVGYERWEIVDGVLWPMVVSVRDLGSAFELTSRVSRARFSDQPDRLRLTVRIPEDAQRLGAARLRRLLEKLETAR